MPDSAPKLIAKAFAERAALLVGIKEALHYEPEQHRDLPAVSMLFLRIQQDDKYTGPSTENVWSWQVTLTIPVGGRVAGSDLEAAQDALYDLVPKLLGITRASPDLGGTCEWSSIADLGEGPTIDEEANIVTKLLELTARTEETV